MQHYQDVLQDRSGNAIAGAIVTVVHNSTSLPASLYSDYAGTQPLTTVITDLNGSYNFYVASGRYNYAFYKTGKLLKTQNDVFIDESTALQDLSGPSGASMVGFNPTGTIAATTVQTAIAEINTDLAASTGATLVSTVQGGTGAVINTVDAKLKQQVSVFDFMTPVQITDAQGTTSTGSDHYSAFQNALNYVGGLRGGDVLVPPGWYTLSAGLIFPLKNGVSLIGQGQSRTSANNYPCVLAFTHVGSSAVKVTANGQALENLVIQGWGARSTAVMDTVSFGILLEGSDTVNGSPANCLFKNVFASQHPSHGFVSSGGTFMIAIEGIAVRQCKGHALFISDGTVTGRTNKGRPGGYIMKHIRTIINDGHDIVITPLPEANSAYRMFMLDGDLSSSVNMPVIPPPLFIANASCIFHAENVTAIDLAFDGRVGTTVTYTGVDAAGISHRYITCRFIGTVGLLTTQVAALGNTNDICVDAPYISNDSSLNPAVVIGTGVGAITIISRCVNGGGSLKIVTPFTAGYTKGIFISYEGISAPTFTSTGTFTGTQFLSTPTSSVGFTTTRDSGEIGYEVIRTGTGAATGKLRAAGSNIQIGSTSANNVDIIRGDTVVGTFTATGFTSTGTVSGTYVTTTPVGSVGFTTTRDSASVGVEVVRTGGGAATGQLRCAASQVQIVATTENDIAFVRNVAGTETTKMTIKSNTINVSSLPAATTGLVAGDLWVDTAAGNVVKRV